MYKTLVAQTHEWACGTVDRMSLVGQIAELQNLKTYKELSWEGSFEDYLELVRKNPHTTRNAYQRLYDMVLSHGVEEYIDNKKKLLRYEVFRDETQRRRGDDIGLDAPPNARANARSAPAPLPRPTRRT